ncbi:spoIIIJ-associated protein [Frigoribacterium sp. CG_9.8]|nr:spoIIIJ-associated protein [Frigoribacterium sp. CG_9.8]
MSDTIPQRADDTAGPAVLASTATGATNSLRPDSERPSAGDGDCATLDAMGAIPVVATEGAVVAGSARLEMTRSATQLEEEGEIAADYIEELLDITDLDGDIDIDAHDGRAYLAVNSSLDSNLRLLSKPDTVNALQELTRIAVQAKTGVFSRLILDVGGSRQARESELSQLVGRAAERIEGGAQSAALPPMSSYERKLVHDLVAARGFVSQSEGEGADRHTVITRA